MPDTLASHLAARFADDARALHERAAAIERAPGKAVGPGPASCRAMAAACEAASALFAGAAFGGDDAVRALLPQLELRLAGEPDADARHVWAGAVARARQGLDASSGGGDDDFDDGDEDGADEDDGEVA